MIGVIAAGRPVQTEFQEIDESHILFNLPDADNINHIVIFITQPFPENFGGAVYFSTVEIAKQSHFNRKTKKISFQFLRISKFRKTKFQNISKCLSGIWLILDFLQYGGP